MREATLRHWAWKLGATERETPSPPFLEIASVSTAATDFELAFPDGRVLRIGAGFDVASLRVLLQLLEEGR